MKLILRWLLLSLGLLLTVHLVPGIALTGGPLWVLAATLALALLNLLVAPVMVLLRIVTFPLSCLTFGLWTLLLSLFVNVLLFYFVGSLGWGFRVDSFGWAAVGAIVMSGINFVLTCLFRVCWRAGRGAR